METQFGVVWEKMTEAQLNMAGNTKTTTLKATPEPIAYVGEPWRDKTRPLVLITETEETERQTSDVEEDNIPLSQTLDKIPTGEMCIGLTVLKQFDEGLFKGTVTDAKKQRARYLYHVVYEFGDSEDLNEKEFMKAYGLFKTNNETAVDKSKGTSVDVMSDAEEEHSGGETEGSEYGLSEEDEIRHSKKKRRTVQHSQLKEKDTNNRGNNVEKEEETPKTKNKKSKKPIQSNILNLKRRTITTWGMMLKKRRKHPKPKNQNSKVQSKPSSMWKLSSSREIKTVQIKLWQP